LKFFKRGIQNNDENIPNELPLLADDLIKKYKADHKKESTQISVTSSKLLPPENGNDKPAVRSYFSHLLKNIEQENGNLTEAEKFFKQGFLSMDMLGEMKNYWESQKSNVLFTTTERGLRQKLLNKIGMLQSLEGEWQETHVHLIDKEEQIRVEEIELKNMLADFRDLCKRHLGNQQIKTKSDPRTPLRLADGQKVKNLKDLLSALKNMQESTFSKHRSGVRNDFSSWVKDVIKDKALARQLEKARTRMSMISTLKNRAK
jgi:hypothetical protein